MLAKVRGTIFRVLIVFICALGIIPLLPAAPARAATINVPADYATIQAAVNAASPGDTIQIAPGVYAEQVNISKDNLTLVGTGDLYLNPTVITVPPAGRTSYTTHSGDMVEYVVVAHDCQNVTLSNVFVLVQYAKIAGPLYYSNMVFDNATGTTAGSLLSAWNSIPVAEVAVAVYGPSTVTVTGCDVEYFTGSGIFLQGTNTVNINNSYLEGGAASKAINDQGTTTGILQDNEIGQCNFGINLANPFSTWNITGNAIYSNTIGLLATGCPLTSVSGNLIYNNGTGIDAWADTSAVHCNAIMGNTTGLVLHTNGTHDFTGNYWGANSGPNVDTLGPGTGDAITTNGVTVLTYDPWAAMRLTATPPTIPADGTSSSTLDLDMTRDNHGDPLGCTVPDGYPINFTTTLGTISPPSVRTLGGHAITSISCTTAGTATVSSSFQALQTLTLTTGIVVFSPVITAGAGEGGTIAPSGTVAVNTGASQSFTITPAAGYQITDVLVDGVSAGAAGTYTFNNVTANHTISATFASASSNWSGAGTHGAGGVIVGNVAQTNGPIVGNPAQTAVQLPVVNVSAARLSSNTSPAGSPVTVTADVTNTGMVAGSSVIRVYLNGDPAGSKGVSVEAGKTVPVSFTFSPAAPGEYTVTVNGVPAGRLSVTGASDSDLVFIISLAAFALLMVALTVFYVRRRSAA